MLSTLTLSLGVSLLLSGCQGPERFGDPPPPSPTPALPATSSPTPASSLRIRAPSGLRFDPTELRVPAAATVEVLFQNRDDQDHTFVVDELAVLMLAGPGQTVRATVALHPGNRGTFVFYCRIPG